MRLLLDAMYPPAIAVALRGRGHVVDAVQEGGRLLRRARDEEVMAAAAADRRALVSEDSRDLLRIHRRQMTEGRHHFGLVLTSCRSLPRHRPDVFIRTAVQALDDLLQHRPGDDGTSPLLWIP